ncbi:hypothetical protein [Anaeromyxobacter oryzae]|uniref:Uncharacterized protein n=1 Tax=Anaeromyxobacter oryzae TaxID=2918170 RepID=A0ABM7WYH2_9BACT|nr:hypothetical protein [Anaeromyxobacter oryzae]BDG04580.1 hypothetical protein AMOR_35760 [Anaeromyxobacter oryzae]
MTAPALSPGRLAGVTLALWARQLPAFVVLAALAWGVFIATLAVAEWTFVIAVALVSTLHAGGVAAAALQGLRDGSSRVPAGFRAAWAVLRRAPSVVAIGVLSAAAVLVGSAALVVPGIAVAAALAPALPIALGEGAGPLRALARSVELTRGHRVGVALGQLLLGVVAAVLSLGVRACADAIPDGALPRGAASDVVFWGVVPVLVLTALTLPFVGATVAYRALVAAKEAPTAAALEVVFE